MRIFRGKCALCEKNFWRARLQDGEASSAQIEALVRVRTVNHEHLGRYLSRGRYLQDYLGTY